MIKLKLADIHSLWNAYQVKHKSIFQKKLIAPRDATFQTKVRIAIKTLPTLDMWANALDEMVYQANNNEWWSNRIFNEGRRYNFTYLFQRANMGQGEPQYVKYYETYNDRMENKDLDEQKEQDFNKLLQF